MKLHIFAYLLTLVVLAIVDGVWLMLLMSKLYQKQLSHLLAQTLSIWPVAIFYPLFAYGLYFFVIRHGMTGQINLLATFNSGLLLGLVAYGAYDLTNQATLRNWPILITIVDIAWGSLLSAGVSLLCVWTLKKLWS